MVRRGSKHREILAPRPGDILAFRVKKDDEERLIPWLTSLQIEAGDWSDFIRRVLYDKMDGAGGQPAAAVLLPIAEAEPRLIAPLEAAARRMFNDESP